MKLQVKMLASILSTVIVIFSISLATIGINSNNLVVESAILQVESESRELAKDIESDLNHAYDMVKQISYIFQSYSEFPLEERRKLFDEILKQSLIGNPQYLGIWTAWERNQLDGLDEEFRFAPNHDSSGRYIPYFYLEDNKISSEPLIDYDISDYYLLAIQSGKEQILEPYIYTINNEDILMTTISVPIMQNGKAIGVVGVDIQLDSIHEAIKDITLYESGFVRLLSNEGIVIAHPNPDRIGELSGDFTGEKEEFFRNTVKNGDFLFDTAYSASVGGEVYKTFVPIHIGNTTTPWSFGAVINEDEVLAPVKKALWSTISVGLGGIVILVLIVLYITNTIVRPIRVVISLGEKMAEGDFTQKVPEQFLNKRDEVGTLARVFESVSSNMRKIVENITKKADEVNSSASILSENATKTESITRETTMALGELSAGAHSTVINANESARAMEEMAVGIQRVAESSTNVSAAALVMREKADVGSNAVSQAVEQMTLIRSGSVESSEMMKKLQEDANEVTEIIDIITSISDQTNLLALNAAIEAARAGEAGKGFAVVADEIRKLANQTSESAGKIHELIVEIQSNTNGTANSMKTQYNDVEEGISAINRVGVLFNEILTSVQEVSEQIEETSAIAEEMSAGTEEVTASVQNMANIAEEAANKSTDVKESSDVQSEYIKDIVQASNRLSEMSEDLRSLVKQFKA